MGNSGSKGLCIYVLNMRFSCSAVHTAAISNRPVMGRTLYFKLHYSFFEAQTTCVLRYSRLLGGRLYIMMPFANVQILKSLETCPLRVSKCFFFIVIQLQVKVFCVQLVFGDQRELSPRGLKCSYSDSPAFLPSEPYSIFTCGLCFLSSSPTRARSQQQHFLSAKCRLP